MREFRSYEPSTGRNYRQPIRVADLPDSIGYQLVGQWSGHEPVVITSGGYANPAHHEAAIAHRSVWGTVTLNPFEFTPAIPGYYIVHHQRRDHIYAPTAGGYTASIKIDDTAVSGIDATKIQDLSIVQGGTSWDIVKLNLTCAVYCDGDTDTIRFILEHSYSSSRSFGAPIGQNCITHTTIWYVGPKHTILLEGSIRGVGSMSGEMGDPVSMSGDIDGLAIVEGTLTVESGGVGL